jgi:hypothetical protein
MEPGSQKRDSVVDAGKPSVGRNRVTGARRDLPWQTRSTSRPCRKPETSAVSADRDGKCQRTFQGFCGDQPRWPDRWYCGNTDACESLSGYKVLQASLQRHFPSAAAPGSWRKPSTGRRPLSRLPIGMSRPVADVRLNRKQTLDSALRACVRRGGPSHAGRSEEAPRGPHRKPTAGPSPRTSTTSAPPTTR